MRVAGSAGIGCTLTASVRGVRMSRRRWLAVALPLLAVCALVGCGNDKKTEEGRAQLKQRVADQLQAAKAKADAYDFDAANAILRGLPEEVDKSPFADVATYDKVKADIEAVRGAVSSQEDDYRQKTKAGWKITGGKLVSPDDQARAIAEEKRQEEAQRAKRGAEDARLAAEAKARQEAETREEERRRAELQAQEEQARQAREREEAQRKLVEAIKALPALQTALDDQQYVSARGQWMNWSLDMRLISLGEKPKKDPNECLIGKAEVLRRVRAADARSSSVPLSYPDIVSDGLYLGDVRSSPVLLSYRDEILDIVESLDWAVYIINPEARKADDMPIRFAAHQNQPALLLGIVFSDTTFNNVNQAVNTPKKRAAAFAQKEVLPRLLKSRLTDRLRAAQFAYVGLIFVYGNENLVKETDFAMSESLCLVISTRDLVAFVNRELSQEALVKNAAVFLASGGPRFVRVELTVTLHPSARLSEIFAA